MRPLVAAAALLLTLGACHLAPQSSSYDAPSYAPLRARIYAAGGDGGAMGRVLFHVSRPAYVALFEIHPGAGVSLVHPGFGTGSLDGRVFSGMHSVLPRRMNLEQYHYVGNRYPQPRFFFLVASDRPLGVDEFGRHGVRLPRLLGSQFASISAYDTMERLAELAVSDLENDGSWATDFYVEWPQVIYDRPARDRVLISCNGYSMYVSMAYLALVQEQICSRDREVAEPQPAQPDSTKPATPSPRKPLPEDPEHVETRPQNREARQRLMEKVASSAQLQEGREPHVRGGGAMPGTPGGALLEELTRAGSRGEVRRAPEERGSSGGSARSQPERTETRPAPRPEMVRPSQPEPRAMPTPPPAPPAPRPEPPHERPRQEPQTRGDL